MRGALGVVLLGGFTRAHALPMQQTRDTTYMEQAHQVGLALFSCATDNDQKYPDGKTSTEVFQNLMAGGYVTDPGLFFLPEIPNKTKAPAAQKILKPENICFDLTGGADASSPDMLPLIYSTGYRVIYKAGASASPIVSPPPPGIAVMYKNNAAKFLHAGAAGAILNFIPADFPADKSYRQLTP